MKLATEEERAIAVQGVGRFIEEKLIAEGLEFKKPAGGALFYVEHTTIRAYNHWRDGVVVAVGQEFGTRRRSNRAYTDRHGRGYDWRKIIGFLRERIERSRSYAEQQARDTAYLEESQCIMEAIATHHELVDRENITGGSFHGRVENSDLDIATRKVWKDHESVRRYDLRLHLSDLTEAQLDNLLTSLHGVLVGRKLATHDVSKAAREAAVDFDRKSE